LTDSDLWTITYDRARSFRDNPGFFRWSADPDFRIRFFREIRAKFDYILVDCGSLASSSAISSVAPIIDGVILVAGAGVTRRSQLQYARSLVRESGGRLLGSVLDGRTYPLPHWLHRLL
jgi:Mrp family chromosome partitioning ATPase